MKCSASLYGCDPVGSVMWMGQDPLEIVGVVGRARQPTDLRALSDLHAGTGIVYLSLTRNPRPPAWSFLVVRTPLPLPGLADAVIRELQSVDASAVLGDPSSFRDLLSSVTTGQRRLSALLGAMACVVLLLTAASVTAVLSQLVTLRSREIAIRYCLGARRRQIVGLTIKHIGTALAVVPLSESGWDFS
jgi:hypothetical protein